MTDSPKLDLDLIKREEAELMKQLASVRRKKELATMQRRQEEEAERQRKIAAQREADLSKTVLISISSERHRDWFRITVDWLRHDVKAILRASMGRQFADCNAEVLTHRIEQLKLLPNVKITWEDGAKKNHDWVLNAPDWEVDVNVIGEFTVTPGPGQSYSWTIHAITGSYRDKGIHIVPKYEGWRIPKALEGQTDVVYTDHAKELIFGEIERRARLDRITQKEDSDCLREGLRGNEFRPFQRVGLEFGVEANGRFLCGDGTGTGKTWLGIGMDHLLREMHEQEKRPTSATFQTLWVAKSANIPNAVREIKRLAGKDAYVVQSGMPSGRDFEEVVIKRNPYVVISYDTLGARRWKDPEKKEGEYYFPWQQTFLSALPDFLVMDEAHQIKNSSTNRFKAIKPLQATRFVLPMTASPILNRTQELWTVLNMVSPHNFPSEQKFKDHYVGYSGETINLDKLHETIRPMFLRRRKKDVQKDLPPINRVHRFWDLSSEAQIAYQQVLQGLYISLRQFDPTGQGVGDPKEVTNILSQIMRLKQICAADKCEFVADLATELVDEDDENRILIFSQFKGTAYEISRLLGSEAVCTVRKTEDDFVSLDAIKRDQMFEAARLNPKIKYIVTTSAAKEGHNIEFCNIVMFNDLFWGPEDHRQAEGRSYGRLSNPQHIDSYYIVADTDIEKWILELLDKKFAIIEETIDGVENTRDKTGSIANELIKRLSAQMLQQGRKK